MSDILNELNLAHKEFKKRGRIYAESEMLYRIELAKKILLYRTDGMPVTVINDLARGDQNVAQLKFNRDCALSLYESVKETIYTRRLQLKIHAQQEEIDRRGL